ncbi:MAG: class I SAM-dependent methyltransferase [Chloroflexi bacterium]|nr:class I SAM-dependent methyltransferase [Chloroflexota bacterium]MCY4248191.1 class I SAM-dependent methyltransferase [Chloroflexota bacterium]
MTTRLQRQIEYYRARAPEYDEWFYRKGRYDRGPAHTKQWQREVGIVRRQLHSGARCEHILELAPGTGIWTQELAQLGERVRALDASPEMIAINRAKLAADHVDYELCDLFQWQPQRQVDMVFFGFWLSHVPADKLSGFLRAVRTALKPGGRLFLVDSLAPDSSNPRAGTQSLGADRQQRQLKDGRQYEIVKIYYEPRALSAILREHGFNITAQATQNFFLYADGVRSA